jgi:hypothetical protein
MSGPSFQPQIHARPFEEQAKWLANAMCNHPLLEVRVFALDDRLGENRWFTEDGGKLTPILEEILAQFHQSQRPPQP